MSVPTTVPSDVTVPAGPLDLTDPRTLRQLLDMASIGAATVAGMSPDPRYGEHDSTDEATCTSCSAWRLFARYQAAFDDLAAHVTT